VACVFIRLTFTICDLKAAVRSLIRGQFGS